LVLFAVVIASVGILVTDGICTRLIFRLLGWSRRDRQRRRQTGIATRPRIGSTASDAVSKLSDKARRRRSRPLAV
jgi:hypothetical protein